MPSNARPLTRITCSGPDDPLSARPCRFAPIAAACSIIATAWKRTSGLKSLSAGFGGQRTSGADLFKVAA